MPKTSDIYKNLYHYTTWDGLLGILRSKKMWATHYKFLNDYTEITLFRDKLVNLILPHVKDVYDELIKHSPHAKRKIDEEGGLNQVVRHDTEAFVDAQYHATGNEIYIVSFCGEHTNPHINGNGLLSQWRGYGSGGGFSIVFDTQKLEEILSLEVQKYEYGMIHLSDVVYSGDEKKLQEEFYESLTVIADDVKQVFNKIKAPDNDLVLNGFQPFATCISRYKHHGFSEENEVRIVALPTVVSKEIIELAANDGVTLKPEKERQFREKNAGLVPYIEIFDSADIDLPIKRIIVGPHKEKESRAATLRVMLRNTGIEIHCSDIPFTG